MGEGSNVTSVVAAVLFTIALVFAAAAVPALASYSPGGGLDEVGDGLDASNVSGVGSGSPGGGMAGPGGEDGGSGTAGDGSGDGIDLGSEGGSGTGDGVDTGGLSGPGSAPGGGGGGSISPRILRLFGSFLQFFSGGGGGSAGAPSGMEASSAGETPQGTPGESTPTPTPAADGSDGSDDGGASEASEPASGDGPSRTQTALLAGLLLAGLGMYLYRSDRSVGAALLALPQAVRRAFMAAFLGISDAIESAVRIAAEATSVLAVPGELLAALLASLRSVRDDVQAAVPWSGGPLAGSDEDAAATGSAREVPARERIRTAWKMVVDAVVGGRHRRRTPGEIGRAAVDQGLPAGDVSTVVESFRDVEYGGGDPDERVEPVTAAAETLQTHLQEDGEANDGHDPVGDEGHDPVGDGGHDMVDDRGHDPVGDEEGQ